MLIDILIWLGIILLVQLNLLLIVLWFFTLTTLATHRRERLILLQAAMNEREVIPSD